MSGPELRDYVRMFDRDSVPQVATSVYPVTFGDRRPNTKYDVSSDVELAVNIALSTGRPLLLLGPPGSGKTSLGFAVAERLEWDVYDTVVTSRTRAQDLLWTFDNVQRLSDALSKDRDTTSDQEYAQPGVLWWALDPQRASALGKMPKEKLTKTFSAGAVVIIDEIDKADPSVPNDLLRPLGDLEFDLVELEGKRVTRQRQRPPLVFVTSNGERTLPSAFIRRCVVVELPGYDRQRLLVIGGLHLPASTLEERTAVLDALEKLAPKDAHDLPAIGTAEYLDLLRASSELEVRPDHASWPALAAFTLVKRPAREA